MGGAGWGAGLGLGVSPVEEGIMGRGVPWVMALRVGVDTYVVCTHTHVCLSVYRHIHVFVPRYMCRCTYTCMCKDVRVCIYIHTHVCMYTCMYTHILTRLYTPTHTSTCVYPCGGVHTCPWEGAGGKHARCPRLSCARRVPPRELELPPVPAAAEGEGLCLHHAHLDPPVLLGPLWRGGRAAGAHPPLTTQSPGTAPPERGLPPPISQNPAQSHNLGGDPG